MNTNRTNESANNPSEQRLTKKGLATRARIVTAAAKLMFERGVAGTTVEDVQREANVSASQLYHYFKEKRELVLAVSVYQCEQVLDAQEPMLSRLDSLEALRAWRDAIVRLQAERQFAGGCPIGSLASELAEADPAARRALADGFERWELAIRSGLRAMLDRGELKAQADPDRLALALLTALQGGLLLTQVRRDTLALEAGTDAVLEHIRSFLT